MSDAGDPASRLSSALDELFSKGPSPTEVPSGPSTGRHQVPSVADTPHADWSVDDEPTGPIVHVDDLAPQPFVLPAIVPATESVPVTAQRPPPDTQPAPVQPLLPNTGAVPVGDATPRADTGTAVATPPAVAPPPPTTSWSDHMATVPATAQGQPLRSPGRRPRVRRVTRVLRHIDPWSTFKVALLFSAVAYVVLLTAGVLLWRVADSTGTLANIERWFTQFGWETFELKGGEVFHNAWILGLFAAVGLTGGIVLLATLFNLVSDIVGGVRMTVLEEEVVERTVSSTKRYVVRRPPMGSPTDGASDTSWSVDDVTEPAAGSPSPPRPAEVPAPVVPATADWSVDD